MASPEIATLDRASLESFQTELIAAGFAPEQGRPGSWVGPIADSLKGFTASTTMRIQFADGWPFQHPRLHVEGIDVRHVGAGGEVCLWRTAATPVQWLTLAEFMGRIDEWARRAREGFQPEDFALDAHLSFSRVRPGALATVELRKLGLDAGPGRHDVISGTWNERGTVVEIVPGRKGAIEGRWYYVGHVDAPPRDLEGIRKLLTTNQRNNFDRRYRNVAKDGLARLFLIAWDRALGREALVIVADKRGADVVATAIEVAPKDPDILRLRAGPDAGILETKSVLVFGVGAVGSQVALLLARSGLGRLAIIDDGRLRPGDIVRHAASSWFVGEHKVNAVDLLTFGYAPWTTVNTAEATTWNPEQIRSIVGRADLVVDTTGLAAFTSMLSIICEQEGASLLSAALYRGGSVARVRRQALAGDKPIPARADDPAYMTIPPVTNEELVFEPGCSAPVNNASPVAVASVAALTAAVAIDFLAGRNDYPSEIVDVYRPLPEPPFDKLGRVRS